MIRVSRARRLLRLLLLVSGVLLFVPTIGMSNAVGQAHVDRGGTIGIRNETDRALFFSLICTCGCPRETLGTCSCDFASSRRDDLRSMLDQGVSLDAIYKAYVARFGEQALAVPPNEGASRLVWAIPLLAFILGAFGAVRILRRWSARGRDAQAAPPAGSKRDDYDDKLDDELRELDRE